MPKLLDKLQCITFFSVKSMQIDLVIDDFGVHGHPYVFDTVRWRLSCSLQAATASTWLFWNQAGRGRKAAGWRNAEIEHNTPRCGELGGGAHARKFYLLSS